MREGEERAGGGEVEGWREGEVRRGEMEEYGKWKRRCTCTFTDTAFPQ